MIKFEDFITVDKGFELEKRRAMLEQKVVSINDLRSEDGLEPASWGEFRAGSQQDVPFTGAIPSYVLGLPRLDLSLT